MGDRDALLSMLLRRAAGAHPPAPATATVRAAAAEATRAPAPARVSAQQLQLQLSRQTRASGAELLAAEPQPADQTDVGLKKGALHEVRRFQLSAYTRMYKNNLKHLVCSFWCRSWRQFGRVRATREKRRRPLRTRSWKRRALCRRLRISSMRAALYASN